jgi:hypothetical protein
MPARNPLPKYLPGFRAAVAAERLSGPGRSLPAGRVLGGSVPQPPAACRGHVSLLPAAHPESAAGGWCETWLLPGSVLPAVRHRLRNCVSEALPCGS